MTQQRRDGNSTEFGLWTRKPEQREIDSKLGFVTSNIDFVWKNYHSGLWMLLEEKRYRYMPKPYQVDIYRTLDNAGRTDTLYRGFHLLVFENASPDDGGTWLESSLYTNYQSVQIS